MDMGFPQYNYKIYAKKNVKIKKSTLSNPSGASLVALPCALLNSCQQISAGL